VKPLRRAVRNIYPNHFRELLCPPLRMGVEQCCHILIPYPTVENRYRKLLEQIRNKSICLQLWGVKVISTVTSLCVQQQFEFRSQHDCSHD
jgi:hypothetical protein